MRYLALRPLTAFNKIKVLCLHSKALVSIYLISHWFPKYALCLLGWFHHGPPVCMYIYIYTLSYFCLSSPLRRCFPSFWILSTIQQSAYFSIQHRILPQLSSPHWCFQSLNDVTLVCLLWLNTWSCTLLYCCESLMCASHTVSMNGKFYNGRRSMNSVCLVAISFSIFWECIKCVNR